MSKQEAATPIPFGEQEFRELADNAPVMIWRSRPDKLCDWFNKPWIDYSGKSLEQLFGYGWAQDVHPDDYDRCVATYVQAFDARENFTMPYRLRRHDGVYRWFLDNGAPFYRGGEFAGYFGSCIDITEQRDLEDHQRTLLAELNHRVKNNLQLILSFLQLSKMRAVTEEAKRLLEAAIDRVQGVGVVQDELYKSGGGAIDLGSYLGNLVESVLSADGRSNVALEKRMQALQVTFDLASMLGLMVNEVVTNAIKHSGTPALRLQLALTKTDGSRAEIVVRDNGQGFSAEELSQRTASVSASGYGLIKALAARCKAEVRRENDHGATVRISFPLSND